MGGVEVFLTSPLDGGGELHAPVTLTPVPTEFEAGWAPQLVWTF